ncbi:Inner membrane protein YrbG, predicted calcium/sodium:proton antiporter [Lachnospiraceae bacterium TWA4]|nr:Inner membrane protein YrbG, predicted calcium/sodium:proton antiporter [Lachnospiraceae bacterium TWA4]
MEKFINSLPLIVVVGLLVIGFALLVKGADCFVEGSSSIAKRFHVSSIIIGLTIVAMGTSLPEAAVSIMASINNNNEIAVSNAIGSNIFNTMVVLGVCALIAPVLVKPETLKRDIPLAVLCVLLLIGTIFYDHVLGRVDGIVF